MHLRRFELTNFKGIEAGGFDWDDFIVLIGSNNAGKSSVLQALRLFLAGTQPKDDAVFRDNACGLECAIELVGYFDELTDADLAATAIRGRTTSQGEWVLKKKFWLESLRGGDGPPRWSECYFSLSPEETFTGWPEKDTSWRNFPEAYEPCISRLEVTSPRPNATSREALKDLVRAERPDLVIRGEDDWVPNPGGGGNWKSNANSILPKPLYLKAVHDASSEVLSKDASAYGRLVSLILERKLMKHPEVERLAEQLQAVTQLFCPDPDHPECQATEVKEIQDSINERLKRVVGGEVTIRATPPEIGSVLLPGTLLRVKDDPASVETAVGDQGHGLQRTLVLALLEVLADVERHEDQDGEGESRPDASATVLLVEEPELYMHPQMERKMRDALHGISVQPGFQVICTTHSPVFLDLAKRHKSIVRLRKDGSRSVHFLQVSGDLFDPQDPSTEKERLAFVSRFHSTVNEVFFAERVTLLEESTAIYAFSRAAELTALFERHPGLRHDVSLIDCGGKGNIPAIQKALNHFEIPYTVVHDEDRGNTVEEKTNARIAGLLGVNKRHMLSPTDLESVLGYSARKDKPYQALKKVEELHGAGQLPGDFLEAVNWTYFGDAVEPGTAAQSAGANTT